jgi:hypothetical protein
MEDSLSKGLMGTEESLFTIMTYNYPNLIDYFEIESNGLLYLFFENLKNDTVEIKNIIERREIKFDTNGDVGLYVITYNSPTQFEVLLNSMVEYDESFLS